MKKIVTLALAASLVSGCGAAGRLGQVGKAPRLTAIEDPVAPEIEPSIGDRAAAGRGLPTHRPAEPAGQSASLFRTGAGAFLRDQRANKLGDILTIASTSPTRRASANTTSRTRSGGEKAGLASLLGLEQPLSKLLPGNPDPSKLVDANSTSTSTGAATPAGASRST
jgi:flagellar L-ring protein precursor FlgH